MQCQGTHQLISLPSPSPVSLPGSSWTRCSVGSPACVLNAHRRAWAAPPPPAQLPSRATLAPAANRVSGSCLDCRSTDRSCSNLSFANKKTRVCVYLAGPRLAGCRLLVSGFQHAISFIISYSDL